VGAILGCEYIDCIYPEGDGMVKVEYSEVPCKHCGSVTGVVKFGTSKGAQIFWCKKCHRRFIPNDAVFGMRTPVQQIGLALTKFYNGNSLSKIRDEIDLMYHTRPSDGTIYPWIQRWSKVAIDKTKDLKPNVGDEWLADETVLQIGGKNVWFWDVMDAKTRFLLASHMSVTRGTQDAQSLMEDAAKRAGKAPRVVITDKLLAYVDGIERAFGSDTTHIQSQGFTVQPNTNLIERLHGSIKDRTKIMRGLKTIPSAYLFMDGWTCHYNFFRTHDTLGKTPAEEARLVCPFKTWIDVAKEGDKPKTIARDDVSRVEHDLPFARPHKGRKHAQQNMKPRLSGMRG
jgi:transposase-like protein